MKKANFIQRFLAVIIDWILFGLLGVVPLEAALKGGALGAVSILYETILISQWNGQTIGKKIMGIRVVSASGGQVDMLHAFIRSFSKLLSWLCLLLGYLWMLWDDKSQTWHDKLAETFVVEN